MHWCVTDYCLFSILHPIVHEASLRLVWQFFLMTLGLIMCFFLRHWMKVPLVDDVVVSQLFDMSSTWLHPQGVSIALWQVCRIKEGESLAKSSGWPDKGVVVHPWLGWVARGLVDQPRGAPNFANSTLNYAFLSFFMFYQPSFKYISNKTCQTQLVERLATLFMKLFSSYG